MRLRLDVHFLLWKRLEIRRGTALVRQLCPVVPLWKRLEIRRGTAARDSHRPAFGLWKRLEIRRGTAVGLALLAALIAVETP